LIYSGHRRNLRYSITVCGQYGRAGATKKSGRPFAPRYGFEFGQVGIRHRHHEQGEQRCDSEEHGIVTIRENLLGEEGMKETNLSGWEKTASQQFAG
jgi:hypothetical protein